MSSNIFPEVRAFVKELVKNINEGMSLKQYFEDDSDAVTMVFSMESFPHQFQASFCRCCGEYIDCCTLEVPKCEDKEHREITERCGAKVRQRKHLDSIIYWLNLAKLDKEFGDYSRGIEMVKYLLRE